MTIKILESVYYVILIIQQDDEHVVMDIQGIDVAIVNAIRRILLSEVPTVAIDTVHILNNTSVMQV